MTTPIDRAAKAIWEESSGRQLRPAECEHLARAALATTREPTAEVIAAGAKRLRESWFDRGAKAGSYEEKWEICALDVYRAMHDAMMAEGKETVAK